MENKYKVFLGLGTNLGDRQKNLYNAYLYLKQILSNIEVASIYESRPMYLKSQPQFLNTVLSGETFYSPYNLLSELQKIERYLGRIRKNSKKNSPRCIDLDILLYNNLIICDEKLSIPHQRIKEREFVLIPLTELDDKVKDPESGILFSDFKTKIKNQGVKFYKTWKDIIKDFTKEIS